MKKETGERIAKLVNCIMSVLIDGSGTLSREEGGTFLTRHSDGKKFRVPSGLVDAMARAGLIEEQRAN